MRSLLATCCVFATPAIADVSVVTDIPATAAVARAVVGENGEVTSLTTGTESAHDFQLRISQGRDIQNANLLAWIGEVMTPWLEGPVGNREGVSVELIDVAGVHVISGDEHDHGGHDDHDDHDDHDEDKDQNDHDHDDHDEDKDHDDHDHDDHDEYKDHDDHDHGDEAAKEDDHDHDHDDHGSEEASMEKDHDDHDDHGDEHAGHDDHDHGGVDPHAWLDPENAAIWATALAVELAQIDPAHAADYIANAVAFGAEMEALEEDLESRFAAIDSTIYAYHNALGYMAELGLDIEETIAGYDGAAPGPSTLQYIREDMAAHSQTGTPCLLTDPEAPQAMVEALENDTGVTVVSIAPTGLDGQSYAEIVGAIASAVESCVAN